MPSPIWYDDEKYWKKVKLAEFGDSLEPRLDLIVAEAERRTWEAAKKKIESSQMSICRSGELHWGDVEAALKLFKQAVIGAFEAKINSYVSKDKWINKV